MGAFTLAGMAFCRSNCRLPELLTKRMVQYETNREQVGNDGKPREIKGYSEFKREKLKHL